MPQTNLPAIYRSQNQPTINHDPSPKPSRDDTAYHASQTLRSGTIPARITPPVLSKSPFPYVDTAHGASQIDRPPSPPINPTPMTPPALPTPPTSPYPSHQDLPGITTSSKIQSQAHRADQPPLSITDPDYHPVESHYPPPPKYDEWHPAHVAIEYQRQRGLGNSERFLSLINFFNLAGWNARVGPKELWDGHRHRLDWLYWYEEQRRVRRRYGGETRRKRRGVKMEREGAKRLGPAFKNGEDELLDEEMDIIMSLEAEMEKDTLEGKKEEEQLEATASTSSVMRDIIKEAMTENGITDMARREAMNFGGRKWWKSLKWKEN
ncbi:MAG: hypothetical protein Q9170_003533 [Blastenia crenularia]